MEEKISNQKILSIKRQQGISLIPAIVTIFIFTTLTTMVIIPNQQRNSLETNINAAANSVYNLIQASYAYRSDNENYDDEGSPTWPTGINAEGDGDEDTVLVPTYLPFFNNHTPWQGKWELIADEKNGHIYFETDTGDVKIARALIQKIGSFARISDTDTDTNTTTTVQVFTVTNSNAHAKAKFEELTLTDGIYGEDGTELLCTRDIYYDKALLNFQRTNKSRNISWYMYNNLNEINDHEEEYRDEIRDWKKRKEKKESDWLEENPGKHYSEMPDFPFDYPGHENRPRMLKWLEGPVSSPNGKCGYDGRYDKTWLNPEWVKEWDEKPLEYEEY